ITNPKIVIKNENELDGLHDALAENSKVTVLLPDGTSETFTFHAVPSQTSALGLSFGTTYRPVFQPDSGTTGYLEVADTTLIRIDTGSAIQYASATFGTDLDDYNPAKPEFGGYFKYFTHDGQAYGIDPIHSVSWIEDRNGNRVTYSDDAITHSNGQK